MSLPPQHNAPSIKVRAETSFPSHGHPSLPDPAPASQRPLFPLPLFLGRKFPNVEEQSDSPSIRLLEKKKEAKIMQEAMEHKKEVRWGAGRGAG